MTRTSTDKLDRDKLDWDKGDGLLPAIVQDVRNGRVLMLGYMNREALDRTFASDRVTFYSRSRQTLWTKGETSGHYLRCVTVCSDCDHDALLIQAEPQGPTCHRGTASCFVEDVGSDIIFLGELDALIARRNQDRPMGSYTTGLFESGVRRIAQKVGEEGVETALAAAMENDEALLDEAADLVYHLLVLLRSRGLGVGDLSARLSARRAKDQDRRCR